jgi:hypothetical protein
MVNIPLSSLIPMLFFQETKYSTKGSEIDISPLPVPFLADELRSKSLPEYSLSPKKKSGKYFACEQGLRPMDLMLIWNGRSAPVCLNGSNISCLTLVSAIKGEARNTSSPDR